ncbi:hypothetical protein AURDEDRAFT_176401 [Auricularia subglabra TFB-10046 SS5]|uniref:Transmembrane protein n=1 Tax=Auricularia subglabra (strain TFB-10046 / SS5) TaxID=717982 RepID=J0LDC2_AURST|nr:hypothetical protein AURDEDRAFT_176401 [Auricularia subglabra TFB-10046 SS5]
MVKDWNDPTTLYMSGRAFILVVHTCFGIYLCEFLATLGFDISFVRGKRPLNVAAVFYLLARYATLAALVIGIRICNALTPDINCVTWNYVLHACAYGCVAFTSALLYIRVVALSGRNTFVKVFLGLFYIAYWVFVVLGIYMSEAVYVPQLFLCAATNLRAHTLNTLVQFAFDFTCLCLMMFYLARGDRRGGSLWMFLVQQGVVYFACITAGYLFASVFLLLNLNDAVSQAPNVFALLINAVCATRMQRGLAEFYEPSAGRSMGRFDLRMGARMPSMPSAASSARTAVSVAVDVEKTEFVDTGTFAMKKVQMQSQPSTTSFDVDEEKSRGLVEEV